ncbi:MAG: dihydrodipicolinate synthase family protein [Eubacteriales bacterium]|nr:dihydrodipicolinate synthase family protein [Eubacteriales bacterium]
MLNLEGVIVPILTPLYSDERPNLEQLERLTEYLIEGGVNAIFANGTTGEFARFSMEERAKVLETIVRKVNGRIPVIAGVSDCGTRMVVQHIELAQSCGADAVVSTIPYYFPTGSESEQIEFFEKIISQSKLPVLLYNIPAVVGHGIGEKVLDEISDMDGLYGIKDSSGNQEYLDHLLEKFGKKLRIYVGDERLNYHGLKNGASGMVPSLANAFPRLLAAVWEAAKKRDWKECKKHCDVVDRMNVLNGFSDSWMSPNIWRKEALCQMGICDAYFTHPYNQLKEADRAKIREWITYYQNNY